MNTDSTDTKEDPGNSQAISDSLESPCSVERSPHYSLGWNRAAHDAELGILADVSMKSEDYQEGYQCGHEHAMTMNEPNV